MSESDEATGQRPSRSVSSPEAAGRVPDISAIKKRLARVTRRDWSDARMQDFDDNARADMAHLIAIIEADLLDRSERAQPEATPNEDET